WNIKSSKSSTVWRPLLPNLQCMQVPLIEIPSVLDLYTFDVVLSRGGKLSKGYKILPEDCTNRSWVRDGDMKTITLVDEHVKQLYDTTFAYIEYLGCSTRNSCKKGECNWKGRISVFQDKPLNLCNIECYSNYDSDNVRNKPLRILNLIRKTITNRVANVIPSILAT
ncbi:10481_t:CDS:2, partial [Dentiscutata erythropus]